MAPLKILIVGGGITGPALAYWLAKVQCDITIIERTPDLRASGQQIDIRGQGVTCMRRMGLERDVRDKVVDEQGFKFIDVQGRTKAYFEANKSGQGKQSFTSEFEIMRGDLVRIMYNKTKETCKYVFGTTVEDFEQRGNAVWVKFSDGREEEYDLLVGADGQSSRTRRKMLGPNATDPFKFLNLYISYYTVPKTEKDENFAVALVLPGRRIVSTRVDNPKTMQVYLGIMDPNEELGNLEEATRKGDMEKQKEIYLDLFKDAGWEVPRLLDGLKNHSLAKDFYGQKVGQVKMDKPWSKGRVVLLGDAAYCPSPVSGVGTSMGLVGPYVLAGEIARHLQQSKDSPTEEGHGRVIDAALDSYEKTLRPFAERAQKLPRGVPGVAYAETEWGVWIRNFIAGVLSTLRIIQIIQRFSSDDFGGGWKLPDYPELKYEID